MEIKNFLKRKWHRIPIGILTVVMVLILTTTSIFAAFGWLSFTTTVTVDEPLTVEMRWWNYNEDVWTDWWEVDGTGDELTLSMSPAETQTLGIRIFNISYGALTVEGAAIASGYFTIAGLPNGLIDGSNGNNYIPEWTGTITIDAAGDAPPGDYPINFTFTRE